MSSNVKLKDYFPMLRTREKILVNIKNRKELREIYSHWKDYELENGSIANVEIQKIGYMFPGERAACYSADLLLRQYRRLRDKKKKKFTYKDIKPVYVVVLFEKSPEFKSLYEDAYQLCLNVEKVMGMFSQELRMLDVNTTQFMIDTMQEKMEKLQEKEAELRDLLEEKNREKTKLQGVLDDLQTKLAEQDEEKTQLQGKCNEQADLILQLQTKLQEAGIE